MLFWAPESHFHYLWCKVQRPIVMTVIFHHQRSCEIKIWGANLRLAGVQVDGQMGGCKTCCRGMLLIVKKVQYISTKSVHFTFLMETLNLIRLKVKTFYCTDEIHQVWFGSSILMCTILTYKCGELAQQQSVGFEIGRSQVRIPVILGSFFENSKQNIWRI